MRVLSITGCLLIATFTVAQVAVPEKVWFNKSDSFYGYYVVIPPVSQRIQGILFVLDGYGGTADGFLAEIRVPGIAAANEIVTVCIPTGPHLYADSSMLQLLNRVCMETRVRFGVSKEKTAIGGFSAGGTIASRYAQRCAADTARAAILPSAVFAVDSPLDLLALYRTSQEELANNDPAAWWKEEARMIVQRLTAELGDPDKELNRFREASPFIKDIRVEGNEKYLRGIAFRTYHDVDVMWHITNRRHSLYSTNMLSASELVNRLVAAGNENAEFSRSAVPGRRIDGNRHPHSWNIVDETDLIQWVRESLHFYPEHISPVFHFPVLAGWGSELIMFPMDFAPALRYKGFETLRFAPGWGNKESREKWAYTFLWWLDDNYSFNEGTLANDLRAYYAGLIRQRMHQDGQDPALFRDPVVTTKKVAVGKGDLATFTATASIYDAYVTKTVLPLYIKVHVRDCPDRQKTYVIFEVAAASFGEEVWKQLDQLNQEFRCVK